MCLSVEISSSPPHKPLSINIENFCVKNRNFGFKQLDSVGRKLRTHAREQRNTIGSVEVADHASKANLDPADVERHRLGAQPIATAGIDPRRPRKPRRGGPVILFCDADVGASYG